MSYISSGPICNNWSYKIKKSGDGNALFDMIDKEIILQKSYFVLYELKNQRNVVSKQYTEVRKYAAFLSAMDFFHYHKNMDLKMFHEIILDSVAQKPRFDIDIEAVKLSSASTNKNLKSYGNSIRELLICNAIRVIEKYGLKFTIEKDLIVCDSSSEEKYSCHLIFTGFYHNNNLEAKQFYEEVINVNSTLMKEAVFHKFIDPAIYSSLTSLRMLCSTKNGERAKNFISGFLYKEEPVYFPDYKESELFCKTCITFIDNQKLIPIILPDKKRYNSFSIEDETAEDAFEMASIKLKNFDFKLGKVEGSIVTLTRTKEGYCNTCKKVHKNSDAFLTIKKTGSVTYRCYRGPKIGIDIGIIKDFKLEEDSDEGEYEKSEYYSSDSEYEGSEYNSEREKSEVKKPSLLPRCAEPVSNETIKQNSEWVDEDVNKSKENSKAENIKRDKALQETIKDMYTIKDKQIEKPVCSIAFDEELGRECNVGNTKITKTYEETISKPRKGRKKYVIGSSIDVGLFE